MQLNQDAGNTLNESVEENFSFKKLIQDWWDSILYALGYWRIILAITLIGSLSGIGYTWWRPVTYTARLTFVVEESKSSGGSVASALAGQIGIDIGSLSGTSGVLAGDNVLELLKSYSLIKKTLLTPYNDTGSYSLADEYAEVYKWKEKWRGSSKVGKQISFPANQQKLSRLEDSLLQRMMKRIVEDELSIAKPDKKLGFFELNATTRDERLSQLFCERLLKITTDFYISTKTRRQSNNVYRLQRRADSLAIILDQKTFSNAAANQLLLDGNPAYSSPMVDAEISTRNKFIQSTVYAEIVKNLEVSKTALLQETPTVQIVDYPEFPLKDNKIWWLTAALVGGLIGLSLSTIFFAAQKD
jgi:hypothetical protein